MKGLPFVSLGLIVFAVLYLSCFFISGDPDFRNWEPIGKLFGLFISVAAYFAGLALIKDSK